MSPLLKMISLQWEGRDAYNFSISNCVVLLHTDQNIFDYILFTFDFSRI